MRLGQIGQGTLEQVCQLLQGCCSFNLILRWERDPQEGERMCFVARTTSTDGDWFLTLTIHLLSTGRARTKDRSCECWVINSEHLQRISVLRSSLCWRYPAHFSASIAVALMQADKFWIWVWTVSTLESQSTHGFCGIWVREFLEIGSELSMQHCLWRKDSHPKGVCLPRSRCQPCRGLWCFWQFSRCNVERVKISGEEAARYKCALTDRRMHKLEYIGVAMSAMAISKVRTDYTIAGLQEAHGAKIEWWKHIEAVGRQLFKQVIAANLGKSFLEPPGFNLEKSGCPDFVSRVVSVWSCDLKLIGIIRAFHSAGSNCKPLIFVLSSGADPMVRPAFWKILWMQYEKQLLIDSI